MIVGSVGGGGGGGGGGDGVCEQNKMSRPSLGSAPSIRCYNGMLQVFEGALILMGGMLNLCTERLPIALAQRKLLLHDVQDTIEQVCGHAIVWIILEVR